MLFGDTASYDMSVTTESTALCLTDVHSGSTASFKAEYRRRESGLCLDYLPAED